MSTTTSAIVAHTSIAQGLRVIADMFDKGDMPTSYCPEQGETIHYYVRSATSVRELAARLGVEVDVHESPDGTVLTSFEYPIGKGTRDTHFIPSYMGAVVLQVAHLSSKAVAR